MKRSFSKREMVLLGILAVLLLIVGYYMLVDMPVRDTITQAELRQSSVSDELMIDEALLQRMHSMQESLDSLKGTEKAIVPDYDNSQNVMRLLNQALASTDSYSLSFHTVTFEERIASRTIDMSFTCQSYDIAEQIIRALYYGGYRCEISPVSFITSGIGAGTGGGSLMSGGLSGTMSVTFFEYISSPEALPETAAETEAQA